MHRARPSAVSARPRRRSFSIVEILAVIGIISVLIAILFPVLAKARRSALVLACPIAYVGQDGAVYLTNLNGNAELRISPPGWKAQSQNWLESPMAWSPSGQRLAFQYFVPGGQGGTAFMNVMSGHVVTGVDKFGGWVDSDLYIGSGAWSHRVFSVDTGRMVSSFRLPDDRHYDSFAPVPATSDGAYIASWHGHIRPTIGLVSKSFMPARPICTWGQPGEHIHLTPRVDPTGQWAAWSYMGVVYIHSMRDHSHVPPTRVPMPNNYQYPEFCDWTEESRLLVNVRVGEAGALVVLETDGRLVRQVPVTMPPALMSVAAYRKYEHR